MRGKPLRSRAEMSRTGRAAALCASFMLLALTLPACNWFPAVDLSPKYTPPQYVVPASWHGSSPFVEAMPADSELRPDWWKLYDDPVLNRLIEQAMAVNGSASGRGALRSGPQYDDEGTVAVHSSDRLGIRWLQQSDIQREVISS